MHASMKRLHQVSGLIRKKDIADALGVAQSTVTNWGTRGVSREAAMEAAVLYGVDAKYILDGNTNEGDKTTPIGKIDSAATLTDHLTTLSDQLMSTQVKGGLMPVFEVVYKGFDGAEDVVDFLERPVELSDDSFALMVTDRSMQPDFFIGDYAVVDTNITASQLRDGDFVVAQYKGSDSGVVLKALVYGVNDIRLVHTNDDVGDTLATPITDYHLLGIVDRKVTKFR